ncbi:MAG: hypothetical protein ACRDT1_12200, partial [Micromonosporaceae bacterium]
YADRIAIMTGGEIVAIDSPASLKGAVGLDRVRLHTTDDEFTVQTLAAAGLSAWVDEGSIVVYLPDAEREVSWLLSLIRVPILSMNVQRPSLDDVFLHFTERSLAGNPKPAPRAITQRGDTR